MACFCHKPSHCLVSVKYYPKLDVQRQKQQHSSIFERNQRYHIPTHNFLAFPSMPMASLLPILLYLISTTGEIVSDHRKIRVDDDVYCESWRFSVETNNAGYWSNVPARCVQFVQDYVTGDRYRYDSEVVAENSLRFAKTVEISDSGSDGWVFDIDETLLSNLPYYQLHGFG